MSLQHNAEVSLPDQLQDISRLIVPSAETLATYWATDLDYLINDINEGWTDSISVQGPRS